jgi:hypothetical protein
VIHNHINEKTAELAARRLFDFQKDQQQMLDTSRADMVQRINQPKLISAGEALALARERFPHLAASGILGRRSTGPPIDPAHVERALAFLAQCRKSNAPAVHSFDLRAAIGNVSVGATIAAAIALGFSVHSWLGIADYAPHVMVGVNRGDVARHGRKTAP